MAFQNSLISSFLEVAVGQSRDTAMQFLDATSWKLEEALQLFFLTGESSRVPPSSSRPPIPPEIRETSPIAPEILYAVQNFEQQQTRQTDDVWETNRSGDNLASLYRPPYDLMFHGSFNDAKLEAHKQNRWLLVNLQSIEQFSSHMLNRETWSHKTVAQTIMTNFIFWQTNDDSSEGKKVCNFYHLISIPSILVIDPVTGQKLSCWSGMVEPERLMEDLLQYMDNRPMDQYLKPPTEATVNSTLEKESEEDKELLRALAASMEEIKSSTSSSSATVGEAMPGEVEEEVETTEIGKLNYPPLPEEPKGEKGLLSRVAIRLPDGKRVQRNFLQGDSIQLLWSFCSSLVGEGTRPFHFTQVVSSISKKRLDFENSPTFEEAGLSNSIISLIWD